jgi:HTH-type transcriptional regulator/antitoxin HipB
MSTTYPIRIISQLRPILQGFRKSHGLTQAELAARLGVSQQSYARLEANPGRASMARILAVLQALEVELALSPRGGDAAPAERQQKNGKNEDW